MSGGGAEAPVVRAAGGVVWRRAGDGSTEVLLVHRPRYDDWSFPKGKCEAGEDDGACALREVEEETGVRAALGPELTTVGYVDGRGRSKTVRYWAMEVVADTGFEPGDEVDAIAWLPVETAAARLTYRRDDVVLAAFAAQDGSRSP